MAERYQPLVICDYSDRPHRRDADDRACRNPRVGEKMVAGVHRTCSDPSCHGCLPISAIYSATDAHAISGGTVDPPNDRAPWIPEQTLANYLRPDPPHEWHEIDNLTADEAREVAKLAIRRLREVTYS